MTDIVDKFSQQTLIPDEAPHRSIWSDSLPSPDFSSNDSIDDEFTPSEMSYVSTTRGTSTLPSSSPISSTSSLPNLPHPRSSTNTNTVACRRLQRQLNVQLQSCNTHMKDISTLVEDMLTTNTQCRLHKTPSRPYLSSTQSHTQPPPPSGLVPSSKASVTDMVKGNGKGAGSGEEEGQQLKDDAAAKVQPDLGPLVVLACRHIYHQSCLENG